MTFPTPAAYGIYSPTTALKEVVHTLNRAGFVNEDICMMLSPTHPIAGIVREAGLNEGDRQTSSVAAKLIGWLSEFGAVMIPSVGFFIRSQAFFHALLSDEEAPGLCGRSGAITENGRPVSSRPRAAASTFDMPAGALGCAAGAVRG